MKALKWLALTLTVVTLLGCMAGCTKDVPDDSKDKDADPTTTTTTTTTTKATTTTTTQPNDGKVAYTVKVTDEDGNPISGGVLQICYGGTCLPAVTNADGVASWRMVENDYEVYFSNLETYPDTPVTGYTYVDDETKFYFDGETELTIVLKKVA